MIDKQKLLYILKNSELTIKEKKQIFENITINSPLPEELINKINHIENYRVGENINEANKLFKL